MSLDVYLYLDGEQQERGPAIYIRENGQIKEISREEWDQRFPHREPVVVIHEPSNEVYHANITSNLVEMAKHAGLYGVLWHPELCFLEYAAQMVQPLLIGVRVLQANPAYFAQYTPSNGWGSYGTLYRFTQAYLRACSTYPAAKVSVS